ncbi:hypothetical protein P618_200978 [Holospora obtusa F1]|uniref:Uncharacterized protein n=1 Tax=Holospora obtusa F1 TaxID=1399147 RepID=W6TE21_HOLOB|nr:hypothetical protein P618_200978 [Holospora obtusa F1]
MKKYFAYHVENSSPAFQVKEFILYKMSELINIIIVFALFFSIFNLGK